MKSIQAREDSSAIMKRTHSKPTSSSCFGFSLIELLVVIALIGILAAIGMAFIGGTGRETIINVRDQRNAQEVVSISAAAIAAGAKVVAPNDMRGTIENLMQGRKPTSGTFAKKTFRMSRLNEEEIQGVLRYLEWRDGEPSYIGPK